MNDQVDILLATYRGAAYIEEQIDSILSQTYPHFRILIRDDASEDSTQNILERLASRYPEKICLISNEKNSGVKGNFSELMNHSDAPYVLFSDQDDIWLPGKIESSLKLMKRNENKYGIDTPLLVHTDLKVVRSNLTEISPSFWNYTRLNPRFNSLNRLLVQNNVTGCTMLINKHLLNLSRPVPNEAVMHDWWIALTAAAFGRIDFLSSPTILYRQHDSNDVGAKKYGVTSYIRHALSSSKKNNPKRTYEQARVFLERFGTRLESEEKKILEIYSGLPGLSFLERKASVLKYRFFKSGFLRNIHHLFLTD